MNKLNDCNFLSLTGVSKEQNQVGTSEEKPD